MKNLEDAEEDNQLLIAEPVEPIQTQPSQPTTEQTCCQKTCEFIKQHLCLLTCLTILILIFLICFLPVVYDQIQNTIMSNLETLRSWTNDNKLEASAIILSINFATVFFFPSRSFITVLIAFIIKDYGFSFFLSTIPPILAIIVSFPLVRSCCYQSCLKKYKNDINFMVIEELVEESPWKASIIVWVLFQPTPLKLYGFPQTKITFLKYIAPGILSMIGYCAIFTLVGSTIISQTHIKGKIKLRWITNGISWYRQLSFWVTVLSIILSIVLLVQVWYKFKERLNQMKDRIKERQVENGEPEIEPVSNQDNKSQSKGGQDPK